MLFLLKTSKVKLMETVIGGSPIYKVITTFENLKSETNGNWGIWLVASCSYSFENLKSETNGNRPLR